MKKTFAQILKDNEKASKAKLAAKLPKWSELDLEYPGKLCLEQCSSEVTAMYKAALMKTSSPAVTSSLRIADLTGGLGVDSWAFSSIAQRLLYNERNIELREAVERNFSKLGIDNAEFHSYEVSSGQSDWIEALIRFKPDWIYLDPARRGSGGEKLFRPEDCQPDIITLLPVLRRISPNIMVKLSPMADLHILQNVLGCNLKEIRIIEASGEVKELLCIFDSEEHSEANLTIVSGEEEFSFSRSAEASSAVKYGDVQVGAYLLEPHASVLKAGAFKIVSDRFALSKLAPSTHLYTASTLPQTSLFKTYSILQILPFNKVGLVSIGKKYPHAEVSARNIPFRSEELRKRMKLTSGDPQGIHIFGCACGSQKVLIVCSKTILGNLHTDTFLG